MTLTMEQSNEQSSIDLPLWTWEVTVETDASPVPYLLTIRAPHRHGAKIQTLKSFEDEQCERFHEVNIKQRTRDCDFCGSHESVVSLTPLDEANFECMECHKEFS